MENAAKIRLNAQGVEVVPARFVDPYAGWILSCVQPRLSHGIDCQLLKAAVAVPQVEIVRIRLEPNTAPVNCIEALLLRQIQRAQDQRIQYTKNHGVCADSQCQRQ